MQTLLPPRNTAPTSSLPRSPHSPHLRITKIHLRMLHLKLLQHSHLPLLITSRLPHLLLPLIIHHFLHHAPRLPIQIPQLGILRRYF